MSGSSNIQQWNPGAANQESDSAYAADALRSAGAGDPSIFTSATANKLFYQLSTFAAAFAQSLAAKGYVISDASLTTLAGVLANVVTQMDLTSALAAYAQIANFANSLGNPGYQKFQNGFILQWGFGSAATGNGDLVNFTIPFPNAAFQVVANDTGSGASSSCDSITAQTYSNSQMRVYARSYTSGASAYAAGVNFDWIAVGH